MLNRVPSKFLNSTPTLADVFAMGKEGIHNKHEKQNSHLFKVEDKAMEILEGYNTCSDKSCKEIEDRMTVFCYI